MMQTTENPGEAKLLRLYRGARFRLNGCRKSAGSGAWSSADTSPGRSGARSLAFVTSQTSA